MSVVSFIQAACCQIVELYFEIPIAGSNKRFFRERVYCYELYHQLRILPRIQNVIHGEIDKSGHPKFKKTILKRTKPDFLFHLPGSDSSNMAVVEVKHCKANRNGLRKDVKHLLAFLDHDYQEAILLIFGQDIKTVKAKLRRIQDDEKLDLSRIILLWHEKPNGRANRFSLDEEKIKN